MGELLVNILVMCDLVIFIVSFFSTFKKDDIKIYRVWSISSAIMCVLQLVEIFINHFDAITIIYIIDFVIFLMNTLVAIWYIETRLSRK